MLIGIPKIISPELLKVLCEMGHGDEIVIGDGNFPSESMGKRCIRCDGHSATDILDAILKVFPLDTYAQPLYLMEKVPGDTVETPIWDEFKSIAEKYTTASFEHIERFAFYERAKNAYAVIATGESALYACVILKKGVIKE